MLRFILVTPNGALAAPCWYASYGSAWQRLSALRRKDFNLVARVAELTPDDARWSATPQAHPGRPGPTLAERAARKAQQEARRTQRAAERVQRDAERAAAARAAYVQARRELDQRRARGLTQ